MLPLLFFVVVACSHTESSLVVPFLLLLVAKEVFRAWNC